MKKGIRTRIIEDIPEIYPRVVQYRIERMYCRNCGKVVEPDIPDALPSARLSLRTILIAAYLKQAARMSVESVSSAMGEIFGIRISEGEIQDILYRLSQALGPEYGSLVESMRKAPQVQRHNNLEEERQEPCTLGLCHKSGGHIPCLREQ